jgi:hypothetical protein
LDELIEWKMNSNTEDKVGKWTYFWWSSLQLIEFYHKLILLRLRGYEEYGEGNIRYLWSW